MLRDTDQRQLTHSLASHQHKRIIPPVKLIDSLLDTVDAATDQGRFLDPAIRARATLAAFSADADSDGLLVAAGGVVLGVELAHCELTGGWVGLG